MNKLICEAFKVLPSGARQVLTFLIKRPPVIIVTGKGRKTATEAINKVLKPRLKGILIKQAETKEVGKWSFFIRHSRKPVLVVTNIGEIPIKEESFTGKRAEVAQIRKLTRNFPLNGSLILNFDDKTVREIGDEVQVPVLTFGFQEGADFLATDIKETYGELTPSEAEGLAQSNTGTNFKINYEGKIIPVWLENLFGKEQISAALAATACGVVSGLNLVDISQSLKTYFSVPGRQRLIKGIKNTLIFDDSENASLLSMIEALEILGRMEAKGKKITVLGDILGIGKYSIEAHEAIGEKVSKVADLLFTIGPRAKFIAQGALMKGFDRNNIFQFNDIEKAGKVLQEKIKQGDLILVDGSKELKMVKMVEEIKEI